MDSGKFAPAASTGGYRRVATASGPQASKGEYTATLDIGKQMPAGTGVGDGYRRIVHASGPEAGHTAHKKALDPGHNAFLAKGGVGGEADAPAPAAEPAYEEEEPAYEEEAAPVEEEPVYEEEEVAPEEVAPEEDFEEPAP